MSRGSGREQARSYNKRGCGIGDMRSFYSEEHVCFLSLKERKAGGISERNFRRLLIFYLTKEPKSNDVIK